MNIWWILLLGGLLTFLTRLSFILLLDKLSFPAWVQRALRYVPVAVLTALVFQMIFIQDTGINPSPLNPRLISALLAGVVAWRTRSVLLTILTGMAALFLVQALL